MTMTGGFMLLAVTMIVATITILAVRKWMVGNDLSHHARAKEQTAVLKHRIESELATKAREEVAAREEASGAERLELKELDRRYEHLLRRFGAIYPPPTSQEMHEAEINPWLGHSPKDTILRNRERLQKGQPDS